MSRYSEFVEKHVPKPPIVPTDWNYVRNEFDDIIDGAIIAGNKEGPERYPQVRNFHQHDQPNPLQTSHGRISNYAARNVCAVLETIRVALRVSGKLP